MKLTPRQKYQIILAVIEEAHRLAIKFGLNNGAFSLEEFKNSIQLSTGTKSLLELVVLSENELSMKKKKPVSGSQFKQIYKKNTAHLIQLLGSVFSNEPDVFYQTKEFGKILTDKEFKNISRLSDGSIDINQVLESVRARVNTQIKLIFGVTRKDIMNSRALLAEQLSVDSGSAESTIVSCSKLPQVLLNSPSLQNFNYHGIYINGLYKFIKIINGIQDERLASALLHFFIEDNQDNRQVMTAFFANEQTQLYCRNSTMLVQILSLMVKKDKKCNDISDQFVSKLIEDTSITSIDFLKSEAKVNPAMPHFQALFESALDLAVQFRHILSVARNNIAAREDKINELNSSPDLYLRSAFYFCFISPLLEIIDIELKLSRTWPDLELQKLRLELSRAFHILLGMSLAVPRANSTAQPSVFLDLVIGSDIQAKVTQIFAGFGASDSDHQCSVKLKHIELGDELEDTSSQPRRVRIERDGSERTRNASESSVESGPKKSDDLISSKRRLYSTSRTISFYSSNKIGSTSSSASSSKASLLEPASINQPDLSSEDNKVVKRRVSHAVISKLPLSRTSQNDVSLADYFNELFSCDFEKATHFVLSLVKTKDKKKLIWGVRVLNEACHKSNKQIAALLTAHLSEAELLTVFAELLKEETDESWCRGNKLLSMLIQQFLAHEESNEFKKKIWESVLSLSSSFSQIKVKQRESMLLTPEGFDAEPMDVETVQSKFASVVSAILSPKMFPSLIQKVLSLSYFDLLRREEPSNADEPRLRKLLALILLRFINPIIYEQAQLLTDSTMKMWYLKILPTAIQSLSSPLSIKSRTDDESQSLQDMIFAPVTKDHRIRETIGQMILTELCLDSIAAKSKDTTTQSKSVLDITECLKELNDLLQQEQFSGLSFKAKGNVTPRKDVQKPLIQTFFGEHSDEDNDSPANIHSFGLPGVN
ncbi:hypothetical protein Lmor_1688 [Legionella moravica]|uniref:Uncharacterized protein n=1 Tax=Legionella moravica TaxID=39962 RepID=A0A378K101_9GAMM|nr:hypothetical protein [Legionella moravica]KTD34291.1 hypothetical protein Lmor_1688 [Legionella moravica]STX64007.1 Uncharacterised protein [Legionella moravica]